jgi:archaetidylinositol phosphate synthase
MNKPWDARLAYYLVLPLKDTWVTPNQLTTVRLLTGLIAVAIIAWGENYFWQNLGAAFFVLSAFIDHTDGELARLSGKSSKWGHQYDLLADAVVLLGLFLAIGYNCLDSALGMGAIPMSVAASIAISGIFYMMNEMELRLGKEAAAQPSIGGFEAEDILYLFPLVTIFNGLVPFLIAATIGAPLFGIYVLWEYRQIANNRSPNS